MMINNSKFPFLSVIISQAMKNVELIFWVTSLILLAMMDPRNSVHFSLCIFKLLGLSFCPGCGLGHSISFLFHGNVSASLHAHPLGIFALIIILIRIFKLFFLSFKNHKNQLSCN
ncbi:MAG: DUF2752 domain-containing protein [Ginsengibacter sp.]